MALGVVCTRGSRTGQVWGEVAPRKRQAEFLALLEQVDAALPASVTLIYLIVDTVLLHRGKQVLAWLASHPRFALVFPPVPCSWMNQIEQWFSILVRKRLRLADFSSPEPLRDRLLAFIREWKARAHSFLWTQKSFEKVLTQCEEAMLLSETSLLRAA